MYIREEKEKDYPHVHNVIKKHLNLLSIVMEKNKILFLNLEKSYVYFRIIPCSKI